MSRWSTYSDDETRDSCGWSKSTRLDGLWLCPVCRQGFGVAHKVIAHLKRTHSVLDLDLYGQMDTRPVILSFYTFH